MLIAANVAERDAGNPPFRYLLEIQWPATPAEDLDPISSGTDKPHRSLSDDQLILKDPRPDIDLVRFTSIFECCAWSRITARINTIDDQCSST
jgi:hypothetical protein